MLGYVTLDGAGAADALLAEVAGALRGRGWPLAGAVQVNPDAGPDARCHMDLHILSNHEVIRISQDLGTLSKGCRLDPAGLEAAAGLAEAALAGPGSPRLAIANKFGKTEADGRGFRPFIGRALEACVPVLTGVGAGKLPAFRAFAGDLDHEIAPDPGAVLAWAEAVTRQTA